MSLECLNSGRGDCSGPVEMYTPSDRLTGFPRCVKHQEEREVQAEELRERYPDSFMAPAGFDPSYAGERWEDD